MTILNKCPNCSSSNIHYWGKTSGKITLHDSWYRCEKCSLIFANPAKSLQEIKEFYTKHFYEEKIIDPNKIEYIKLFDSICDLILKFNSAPKTLLEIGCGNGLFLQHFTNRTHLEKVVGIEFDKRVTDKIKLRSPFKSYNDYYEAINLNETFQVIFAWHVIEHVIDVNQFLQKIHRDLQDNGIVVLGTPAFGILNETKAILQKILKKEVTVGTSSDHTFFFSQKVLVRIIGENGFKVLYKRVYVDNVNKEIDFKTNFFKAIIFSFTKLFMSLTSLPLFGKQIIIFQKSELSKRGK